MAQYKTHCFLNIALFLPCILAGSLLFSHLHTLDIRLLSGSFLFSTFFLSPDLDLAHKIKLFSLRGLFSLPFRLYPRFFRHRGVSHIILVGTISRILWLGGITIALFLIFFKTWPNWNLLYSFFTQQHPLLLSIFIGIILADFSHILIDIISSNMK